MPPHQLSAAAAAAEIRAGRLTSEELVRSCLERIAAREDAVRAWAHLDGDHALAQARARDAQAPVGPLHGVPVGVKDIIDTADLPTEHGSIVHAGNRPSADAACVSRLRGAGAVVLGKTVSTEFALFEPGPTRHPLDPSRTPGGSSSGSAAAVADRMVPLALGTQTAGSVVRPAAFCGVFGHKPTLGAVPTDGVKPAAPSLDTVGAFARSSDDLALWLEVCADPEILTHKPAGVLPPEKPWVGVLRTPWWDAAAPSTKDAIDEMADRLAALTPVDDLDLPAECEGLMEAQVALMAAEVAESLAPEEREAREDMSESVLAMIERGRAVGSQRREEARALAQRCRPAVDALLAAYDVVVAPAVVGEAPQGTATGDPVLCRPWTLLGNPTVAVPGLRGPAGLPLGVQVVAPRGRDREALAAAGWLATRLVSLAGAR